MMGPPRTNREIAKTLDHQVRRQERIGVPFLRACQNVADDIGSAAFKVSALVTDYRESLGATPAPATALPPEGMTESEYAAARSSADLVDAVIAAFER